MIFRFQPTFQRVRDHRGAPGLVAVLICLAVWVGPWTAAVTAGRIQRTTGGGLAMTVDTRWTPGPAYRYVQIELVPQPPSVADRTLTIEFLTRRPMLTEGYDQRVVQDVEIPAGSGPIRVAMAIPQAMGGFYQVTVLEDGQEIKALAQQWTADAENAWIYGGNPGMPIVEEAPRLLIVDRGKPKLENLGPPLVEMAAMYSPGVREAINRANVSLPNVTAQPPATASGALGVGLSLASAPNLQLLDPGQLPKRWIDYSNYDLLILSLDEFQRLEKQDPAICQAILWWTAAGGSLLVYGMGEDWQRLAELERLLGFDLPDGSTARKPTDRGWLEPTSTPIAGQTDSSDDSDRDEAGGRSGDAGIGRSGGQVPPAASPPKAPSPRLPVLPEAASAAGDPRTPTRSPFRRKPSQDLFGTVAALLGVAREGLKGPLASPPPPSGPARFVMRPLGGGMLIAVAPQDPFAEKQPYWARVYNTLGPDRLIGSRRYGVVIYGDNPQYWDFLIPGVGLPPILEFRLLISIFVVAIGPVNYFLLRRWRRLHLLVVTVPVTAALVTGMLLVYALMADGLGTRVRARSFTWLDQRHGEAVCWARLSYYAGLAPQRGLTFSLDVVVLPLNEEFLPEDMFKPADVAREMLWEGHQRLARGWIAARTPMQLLTVRARASDRGLRVVAEGDSGRTLRVENRLGTTVGQLLLRKGDRYYWAEDVGLGATVEANEVTATHAISRLRGIAIAHKPEAPRGISRQGSRYRPGLLQVASAVAFPDAARQTNCLERLLAVVDPTGPTQGVLLEPDSYVAIVHPSPEVELGLPGAREEASFHVVQGAW